MVVACLDMEGVLFPEIWINVAERTGIPELRLTTRDVADYDELMQYRIKILHEHKITLGHIQEVIGGLEPLPGAPAFIEWLRRHFQLVILSDTFYQFAMPLMAQVGYPVLFCHELVTDDADMITGYKLRQPEAKRQVVRAFREDLLMKTVAMGDSYNDTLMLAEADRGVLFRPPQNVIDEFPQFPVVTEYEQAQAAFAEASRQLIGRVEY